MAMYFLRSKEREEGCRLLFYSRLIGNWDFKLQNSPDNQFNSIHAKPLLAMLPFLQEHAQLTGWFRNHSVRQDSRTSFHRSGSTNACFARSSMWRSAVEIKRVSAYMLTPMSACRRRQKPNQFPEQRSTASKQGGQQSTFVMLVIRM